MSKITTYTGLHMDPSCPKIEDFRIEDIAHALSLTCRGNGHVQTFFSVAQHCIFCAMEAEARECSPRFILACLLHDASEAYLSDVPRPFKKQLTDYQLFEQQLLDIIYLKYLGSKLTNEEEIQLKAIDDDFLYFDLKYLLKESVSSEEPKIHIKPDYQFQDFQYIEKKYLEIFNIYSKLLS